jgi:glucarate dehydratase
MHSGGELGISLAAMLHLGSSLSNLAFAADAHYHHVLDDVIRGGKFKYVDGHIAVPTGPGLGVELDEEKVGRYAEEYKQQGHYHYNRDPGRPDWVMSIPGFRYAEVGKHRPPKP